MLNVRRIFSSVLLIACSFAALPPPALADATSHNSLFDAMGGEPALKSAVDHFARIVEDDNRINFTFAQTDIAKFKQLLYEQLCQLSEGPCTYTGRDMRTAHAKLNINEAEFNALAEDLYVALGRAGIPYRLQNRLMALLAPMHRDIVKTGRVASPAPSPSPSPH